MQNGGVDVRDVEAANRSAALYKGHHGLHDARWLESPASSLSADVDFVGLDDLPGPAQRWGEQATVFIDGFPDALTPMVRWIWWLLLLFLRLTIKCTVCNQICSGTWLASETVPTLTVKGFMQA
jgi:hypothetical protein